MASATQKYKKLYKTASEQDGFFTTKQAISAGYETNSHPYHVKTGNWVREHRSIYRLANFPINDRPDLMLWYLWSRNRGEKPQGVYSHDTALAIHDLTDLNPGKLHMTVPKSFRRNSQIPGVLVLHYGSISLKETEEAYGVKITNPIRTIMDIITEGNHPEDLLIQAVEEAINKGAVTKRTLKNARQENTAFDDFLNKIKL
jgi:predicted transcriptional regulator of viral defense system